MGFKKNLGKIMKGSQKAGKDFMKDGKKKKSCK